MTTQQPATVTFDFWNTIAHEPPGLLRRLRFAAVRSACERLGMELEDDALRGHLAAAGALHELAWTGGRIFVPREAADHLAAAVGSSLPAEGRAELTTAFLNGCADANLELAPDIGETLEALKVAGARLAIVCDVGLTPSEILRGFLARHGLLGHFDAWAFSDEIGAYKPAAAIFHAALGGTDPRRAAHVGDLRRTDVAGAAALGMTTVRYRGLVDDPGDGPEADHVVDDHRLIPELLGLA